MIPSYVKQTVSQFLADDCPTKAAALAYYITFSLAPLLLIIISVAGLVVSREQVQGRIEQETQDLLGPGAASEIGVMVRNASEHRSQEVMSAIIGFIMILVGATSVFAQLQSALNGIWHVKPDPRKGGVKTLMSQRLLSFAMILGVALLLLVSLVISAAIAAFGGTMEALLPPDISAPLLLATEWGVSFLIALVLFAAVFKLLPDAVVQWREVWLGAAITALLFTFGKSLIALYLGRTGLASAYGAAGSLAILLVWIYYSSMIVLFGAEFTKVWAESHGRGTEPKRGAVRVVYQELRAT